MTGTRAAGGRAAAASDPLMRVVVTGVAVLGGSRSGTPASLGDPEPGADAPGPALTTRGISRILPPMPPAKSPRKRFTKRTILASFVLVAVLIGLLWDGSPLGSLALRQAIRLKFRGVRQVSPAELVAWMADPNRPPPLLIDARPPEQYAVSRIAGSVEIDPTAPDLHPLNNISKDQPLVVYDATGVQGTAMVIALTSEGFTRASNLEGGLFRWTNEGHPIVADAGPATKVYPLTGAWGRLLKSRFHP